MSPARIKVVLAEDHCSGAAACNNSSSFVGCENSTIACTACKRLSQIAGEAAEEVDQAGLTNARDYRLIISRGFINKGQRFDACSTETAEPVDAINACTSIIVIGCSSCGDDADGCIKATSKPYCLTVRFGHEAAKFRAAL